MAVSTIKNLLRERHGYRLVMIPNDSDSETSSSLRACQVLSDVQDAYVKSNRNAPDAILWSLDVADWREQFQKLDEVFLLKEERSTSNPSPIQRPAKDMTLERSAGPRYSREQSQWPLV
jgi:hypothetical protein